MFSDVFVEEKIFMKSFEHVERYYTDTPEM